MDQFLSQEEERLFEKDMDVKVDQFNLHDENAENFEEITFAKPNLNAEDVEDFIAKTELDNLLCHFFH